MRTVKKRFLEKIERAPETGCWLWTAACNGFGYGVIRIDGKNKRAHRVSWELHKRPLRPGELVLHRCDTPGCVNPDHLFTGSHADNTRDKVRKSRQAKGETNGFSKLDEKKVSAIRAHDGTHKEIAAEFGISKQQVYNIRSRKHWGHVA